MFYFFNFETKASCWREQKGKSDGAKRFSRTFHFVAIAVYRSRNIGRKKPSIVHPCLLPTTIRIREKHFSRMKILKKKLKKINNEWMEN
jgi:hypothetical protein